MEYPARTRIFVPEKSCPTSTWPLLQPHPICSHSVFLPRTLRWLCSHPAVGLRHTRESLIFYAPTPVPSEIDTDGVCTMNSGQEEHGGTSQGPWGVVCLSCDFEPSCASGVPEDAMRKNRMWLEKGPYRGRTALFWDEQPCCSSWREAQHGTAQGQE